MGQRRSWPDTGLRIGSSALAAGFVLGAAGRHVGAGEVGRPLPPCRSRSDCGPRVMGGLQITFTGWSCTTGFVARDTETASWSSSPPVTAWRAAGCRRSGRIMAWRSAAPRSRPSIRARTPTSARSSSPTHDAGDEVYGSSRTDIRSVTGLGVECLADGRLQRLPLGRDLGLALRIDRRGRCRCDHRWTAHPPHVVDRLSIGRRGQRFPGPRRGWASGGHRDRDDADADRCTRPSTGSPPSSTLVPASRASCD